MRRIFTSTFFVAAFVVASLNSFGQCPGVVENFNNTGGSTAMFNGTTPAGGSFGLNSNQLRFTVPNGGGTFTLTTRTFTLANGASNINFGFTLATGNQASVTGTTVAVKYVNTSGVITTTSATAVAGGGVSANSSASVCGTVAIPADISTTNRSYQLIFSFSTTGNGNPNSFFTIDDYGTTSAFAGAALPVRFQSLDAKAANNSVSLKWSVGTEDNVSSYQVEKSTDGQSYSPIGSVKATGEGSYLFVDSKLVSVAYYRIKSVDVNGKYGYSTVALVKSGQSSIVLKAFPTPFVNNLSIQHPTAVAGSSIIISSADGRVIKTVVPAVGMQQTDINLSSAKSGLYVIRYSSLNGDSETLKVVKQ